MKVKLDFYLNERVKIINKIFVIYRDNIHSAAMHDKNFHV